MLGQLAIQKNGLSKNNLIHFEVAGPTGYSKEVGWPVGQTEKIQLTLKFPNQLGFKQKLPGEFACQKII